MDRKIPEGGALGGTTMGSQSSYTRQTADEYRNGAAYAVILASPCEDANLRDAYLSIARNWVQLAEKIEDNLNAERN